MRSLIILFVLFLLVVLGFQVYDLSELNHISQIGQLVDKWHEEDCTPMYDSNGNYIGENCSDIYTVVLMIEGERIEQRINYKNFKNIPVNTRVNYEYDLGRLGFMHNVEINPS